MDTQATSESPKQAQNVYRKTLRALRPALVYCLIFSALVNVLMLTGSVYMLQVYDRVLSSGSLPTLFGLFTIVVILYVFLAIYDFLRTRMLSRGALRLDAEMSEKSFQRWLLSGLPDEGFAKQSTPLRDVDTLRSVVSSPAMTALFDLPYVPLFLAVLFMIHPALGALTVGGACVAALLALLNRSITERAVRKAAMLDMSERDFTDLSRRSSEAITAMGMQATITSRWSALHQSVLASTQAGSDPSEMLASGSRAFKMLLQSGMLTLGALLVLQGKITPGMIIASSILSGRALAPIDQLIGQWRTIARGIAAHQRLDDIFADGSPEPERITLPDPTGHITVHRLSKLGVEMPGRDQKRILTNINFELNPGDGLGVIGNSASGKSTLARLLVGAGIADEGEIRLDGATPDQWEPTRLGRHIGYLPQRLEMLPGTIRDNICRFQPDAKDEDILAAAALTGVHDIILGLPEGYATYIGVPGQVSPLSGGQIQRLGLARAVFGMPSLVVLDEPNSNLDVAGDQALTHTIAALRKAGSVVVVMAHRPSALAALDKLMVLDNGKIKKFGEKADILKSVSPGAAKKAAPKAPQIAPAPKAPPKSPPALTATPQPETAKSPPVKAPPVVAPKPAAAPATAKTAPAQATAAATSAQAMFERIRNSHNKTSKPTRPATSASPAVTSKHPSRPAVLRKAGPQTHRPPV